jgi:hypothetical protein
VTPRSQVWDTTILEPGGAVACRDGVEGTTFFVNGYREPAAVIVSGAVGNPGPESAALSAKDPTVVAQWVLRKNISFSSIQLVLNEAGRAIWPWPRTELALRRTGIFHNR